MKLLDIYLHENNTNRNRLSKINGIRASTLQRYINYTIDDYTIGLIKAISKTVNKNIYIVIKELSILNNSLENEVIQDDEKTL